MKSASGEISAIVYSNRSRQEILEDLKPYIALGDSLENVAKRNDLAFVLHPNSRLSEVEELISKEAGIWISVAGKYGIINIVRLRAVVGGVSYHELKLGEKPLPSYFPYENKAEESKDVQIMRNAFRKAERVLERKKMPFFKRLWHEITDKD